MADRQELRSVIITPNPVFGESVQVFQNEKRTTALLDRLTHHSHILTTKRTSYRKCGRLTAAKNASVQPQAGE